VQKLIQPGIHQHAGMVRPCVLGLWGEPGELYHGVVMKDPEWQRYQSGYQRQNVYQRPSHGHVWTKRRHQVASPRDPCSRLAVLSRDGRISKMGEGRSVSRHSQIIQSDHGVWNSAAHRR
jgi:hypothetical protein